MTTISQRELRNDNAEIIRGVERGESYTITRRGVPIARLEPVHQPVDLQCVRPATERLRFADLPRVDSPAPIATILDDLRDDR